MRSLFLVCAVLGGVVVIGQALLGVIGAGHGHDGHDHGGHDDGLNLLSVRALSAGLAFLGIGGLAGQWLGLGSILAIPIGLATGFAATYAVAVTTRSIRRLESDRSTSVEAAIGETGTVYLTIPGGRRGVGKVHVSYGGRLTEVAAVTPDAEIATGERVLVVDVEGDILVVSRAS